MRCGSLLTDGHTCCTIAARSIDARMPETKHKSWQELAGEIAVEKDPQRVADLAQELNTALDEDEEKTMRERRAGSVQKPDR